MPPKSSTRGRKKITTAVVESKNGSNVDSVNGKTETNVKGQVEEIVVPKRGRKKAEVKLAEDKSAEGTTESAISDKSGEKVEPAIVLKRGRKKAEDKSADIVPETAVSNGNSEDETTVAKRSRKKAENESAVVEEKNLTRGTHNSEDKTLEEDGNAPTKRVKRNVAKAEDSLPESQEDVTKRGRRTRNAENTEPESKEVPASGRGRKRKVAGKEEVKKNIKGEATSSDMSASRGRKKKVVEEKPEAQIDEGSQLVVALTRDESLDKLAKSGMKLVKEEDCETKSAVGPKSAAKHKKATEDPEEAKPPKKAKEAPSKAKKDKIPDVTVLDFSNKSKTQDGKEWNVKISSWNVNGIRAWLEKDGMTYLQHEKPDVMCIQETKCSDDKLPAEVKDVEGYHCYWLAGDKDGYSGVSLLSKEKPMSIQYGIGDEEHDGEGRVITAEYDSFYLVTTYVPNSGRGLVRLDYRMKWDKAFQNYLKELDAKKSVVLCGDLNVSHEEIDLANPKSNKKNAGFTKEEREGFTTLLAEGFVDSFRHLYPDQKDAYTFWTYMMNARAKNVGWRLDYFVLSKKLCDRLCDSVIRKDVFGSDHCPISLFLHV